MMLNGCHRVTKFVTLPGNRTHGAKASDSFGCPSHQLLGSCRCTLHDHAYPYWQLQSTGTVRNNGGVEECSCGAMRVGKNHYARHTKLLVEFDCCAKH